MKPKASGKGGYGHKGTMGSGHTTPKARGAQGSGQARAPKAKGVQGRGG